jgi:type II secretory pathway pseudopilin PulG
MAAINILSKKARASSVLEVIISMVIILMVFGIAMMIFTNVTRTSLSAKKLRAAAQIRKIMLQTEQLAQPDDQSFQIDDFNIEVKIKQLEQNDKLNEITVTAFDGNQQKVAQLQKLIISHDK